MELAHNLYIIVDVTKALGGSFKLVTLAPRTVREMTQLPKETQRMGTDKRFNSRQTLRRETGDKSRS